MTTDNHPINIVKAVEDNIENSLKALTDQIESLESSLDTLYIERAKLQRIRRNNGFRTPSQQVSKLKESPPIGESTV